MMRPLIVIIIGIALVTIGFFAAHSVASSWVSVRARQGTAQAREAMDEHLRTAQAFQEAEPDPPIAVTRVTVPVPNPRT